VLVNWYSRLTSAVKWNTHMSRWFTVCSGVRQGGILSPVLFTVFANLFIDELRASGLGCYIFDMSTGCIMYVDDIILLSGSLNDLQTTLSIRENVSSQLRLTLSPPMPLRLYTLPCWSNPPFLIFDIRAL